MQEAALQALRTDAEQGERLCAAAAAAAQQGSASQTASAPSPLEACHAMEGMSEAHRSTLLPRLEGYEAACARFCQRCLDGKVCTAFLLTLLMLRLLCSESLDICKVMLLLC